MWCVFQLSHKDHLRCRLASEDELMHTAALLLTQDRWSRIWAEERGLDDENGRFALHSGWRLKTLRTMFGGPSRVTRSAPRACASELLGFSAEKGGATR